MGFLRGGLPAVLAFVMLVAASSAFAEVVAYRIPLSPANEVPPVDSKAMGSADVTYDTVSHVLTWNITHSGLTGPATAAHFHGPGSALENAPVLIIFDGSLTSPIKGNVTLTADQATQFLAGQWYINIHTAAFPAGELRGQVPKHQ